MKNQPSSPERPSPWRRRADILFLLSRRRLFLLLLLFALSAALTWLLYPEPAGIGPALVAEIGATLTPAYLLLALLYTRRRTRPDLPWLRLSWNSLLLIPAVIAGMILHNLVYALFYPYFRYTSGDEGIFFILTLILLPLYFILALVNTAFRGLQASA